MKEFEFSVFRPQITPRKTVCFILVCLFLKEKSVVCTFLQLFLMDKANLLIVEFTLSCCGSWELVV